VLTIKYNMWEDIFHFKYNKVLWRGKTRYDSGNTN